MNTPIDLSGICIETARLRLRPWSWDDLADFHEYCSDPIVGKIAGWHHHKTMEESREALELFIQEPCVFALELKSNGKAVGSLGIDWLEPGLELGDSEVIILSYDLNRDHWGRGLMPEAVMAVIPYCFDTLKADFLHCGIFAQNRQSRRVAEKCGFRFWKPREYHTADAVETEWIYLLPNSSKRGIL